MKFVWRENSASGKTAPGSHQELKTPLKGELWEQFLLADTDLLLHLHIQTAEQRQCVCALCPADLPVLGGSCWSSRNPVILACCCCSIQC